MDKTKCSEFVDSVSMLDTRANVNMRYGDNDLSSWLLKNLNVREGECVLDIGCGDGNHIRRVAAVVRKDGYCTGIDYDPEMISKANALSAGQRPKISFLTMDMDTIDSQHSPFADGSLDLIYSVYAFYYSKDEFRMLDLMKKKLKPHGRISIVGPHADNNKEWFQFLQQFMTIPQPVLASTTTFMEGVKRYADVNFKVVDAAEFVNNIELPSVAALRDYWKANVYYEKKLDPEFEKYAARHFEKETSFRFPKKALMITTKDKK